MTIRGEDVPENVVSAACLCLWIVLNRTEHGKMPDEEGIRSICANVMNALDDTDARQQENL